MSNSPAEQPPGEQPPAEQPPAPPPPPPPPPQQQQPVQPNQNDRSWSNVQQTRAWVGLSGVFVGAAAITGVTLWGLTKANSTNASSVVAILSSAFTAIATMITAYFGIRGVTNTAQSAGGNPAGGNPAGGNPAGGNPG
jgi:type IV secretory pathway VirB10-like protein